VSIFDKVKEMASESLEKGQELTKTQKLKLDLRKLQSNLDLAYAAYGRRAFDASEGGSSDLSALSGEAAAIRDAKSAMAAKEAEIAAVGKAEEDAASASSS
jgi:hypothetical protein